MIPNHFKLKTIGCDTITPIVLRELHLQMEKNVKVDLAEAFTLLTEAQALYIDLRQQESGQSADYYYAEIGKGIENLLMKYSLEWVLDPNKLEEFVHKFLVDRNFKKVSDTVYENTCPNASFNFYEARIFSAILSDSFAASDFGIIIEEH